MRILIIQCPLFWWEKINLTGDSMIKNIPITELENIATTRILSTRVIGAEIFEREKLIKQALFAANDILKECGLNSELWFRERKNKVFLFNEANRRILAELQIDGEYSSNNSIIRKPKIILLGNRGFLKEKTKKVKISDSSRCNS